MATNSFIIDKSLSFGTQAALPSSPVEGDIARDPSDGFVKQYTNGDRHTSSFNMDKQNT